MNPSKGDCVERGNKLAVEQARSRVIRGSLVELSTSLHATPSELFDELVWLEQNEGELPRVCEQCGRIFAPARMASWKYCSQSCKRWATSEVRVTV